MRIRSELEVRQACDVSCVTVCHAVTHTGDMRYGTPSMSHDGCCERNYDSLQAVNRACVVVTRLAWSLQLPGSLTSATRSGA